MLIMRVSAIQMDMKFADPAYNFKHAEELIREAAASKPDIDALAALKDKFEKGE